MKRFILTIFFSIVAVIPIFAGQINVYTALEDDQYPIYLESFKKLYPDIKVNIIRDSTGIITAKLIAEKSNPQADVVWGVSATSLLVLDQYKLLAPYSPKGIDRVLPQFKDKGKAAKWVGIDAYMNAFIVNLPEINKRGLPIPLSLEDLTKPIYKGLITMPNPASSGTGFMFVNGILQYMGEKKGWEYLDKLHENIAQYTHSGSKPAKLAAQGEYAIGISFGYRGLKEKSKGAPVEVVFPKEGSGWDLEANALVNKKQIKPEAKIFLDWAISDDVMPEYFKNFPIISIKHNFSIPEGYVKEPVKQLMKNDFVWAASNRERILKEWQNRYDSKSEPKK
ncbi:MAG: putative 2-aminoethylphosphonate ABC transporter substrate-binding protein [Calditerrivibrio sp.]|nr:putative 2-aminoethylphosphonate ABC transporter substrate-binding protein [Calditerrivibrio sp.]MCA1931990.1 putative 2-aminoethylphosphonate ABC transporter substrate-binding protein [Calditerrivibrio sp.]MCA1980172.1 putative 2-aminoethylphosphonate ABC transporter substrate-binding protein [Calditerrivibrio sp.]